MTWLEIYALVTPFFILGVVLLVIPLTHWLNTREDRRRER
jgi:hypothetical protein